MKECTAQLDKKHFINVNPYGTFEAYKPIPGGTMSKIKTSFTDVDDMFTAIENGAFTQIVLFFHGGLVGECKGLEAAQRFHRFYNSDNTYTVSFVWETGFLSSLIEHIKSEFLDGFFQSVYRKAAEYILERLGIEVPDILDGTKTHSVLMFNATAILSGKQETIEMVAATKYEDATLEEIEDDLINNLPEFDRQLYLMGDFNSAPYKSASGFVSAQGIIRAAVMAAARCIYRFARKRNHAVKATILEEVYRQIKLGNITGIESLATGIWDEMKEVANKMWKDNGSRKGDKQFAGRYFLDKLSKYISDSEAAGRHVKVELVGHSAGSIAICELFDLLNTQKREFEHIKFNNVIFLAPAVKCDMFYKTLMRRQESINRFRIFTMVQDKEQSDILIDINGLHWVYPMSLLYFVSGLCEDGDTWFDEDIKGDTCLLGLFQHISGKQPYIKYSILKEINEFLYAGGDYNNRIALTPSSDIAPIGYRGRVDDHGKFDNDGDDLETNNPLRGSIRESILHLFTT